MSSSKLKKSLLLRVSSFLFGAGASVAYADVANAQSDRDLENDEIIVTATKRATSLQDTPSSITALGREEIQNKSLVSMDDYLNAVPGVNFLDRGVGNNQVVIRGIALGFAERSTVGTYFGEVPLSNPIISTSTDIKLVDMERIEILRGPQGTLYGGGAMSGAVRNIPNAPNLSKVEGKVTAEYSRTEGANGSNGNVTAVLNLPLIQDELAFRVVGYRFENAGYVNLVSDDEIEARAAATGAPVALHQGMGGHNYTGVRGTVLWKPSDKFDLSFMAAYQKLNEIGRNEVKISLGGYNASALNTGKEFKSDDLQIYNLVANYDLDWGVVTSSTSRIVGQTADSSDLGRVIGWAAVGFSDRKKEGWIEELRFTSQFSGPLQVTTGFYYEDFESPENCCWRWTGEDPSLNPFGSPDLRIINSVATIEQVAVFGEATFEATDWLKFTAGGRWFDYERRDVISESGVLAAGSADLSTSESGTRFKAGVDIKPNEDALIYGLWSQGFRLGFGAAVPSPSVCDTDNNGLLDFTDLPLGTSQLQSDTTENIEVGGKFSLFDNRVVLNTAVYRIDWDDIPVGILGDNPVCNATINGGKARSQGVEIETGIQLTEGLHLQLSGSYVDAEFKNALVGQVGDRLPMSPDFNGYAGLQYDFDLYGKKSYFRADITYVGGFSTGNAIPTQSGDYIRLDLNAGVEFDKFDIRVFADNLTNEEDVTVSFFLDRGWRLRPRTVGLQLGYRF
ncbi:TonB-dependent receptor [Hyphococcus sp. DH-69]|uniref:TonB-dependent receptor n=1 Tax=Hyphococcus formosus TaxID=3143534 RepID=UPI00398A7E61